MFSIGGAALGALFGGQIAREFGLTAPFWVSFGVMVVLTAVAWRLFARGLPGNGTAVAPAAEVVPASPALDGSASGEGMARVAPAGGKG